MDDGCLSPQKRNNKIHAWQLWLNTYLTKEENQVIIDYFLEKWEVQFNLNKHRNMYRLRCSTKEARKFLDIVRDFVLKNVPCMLYKVQII
jgi:hypothetical protein